MNKARAPQQKKQRQNQHLTRYAYHEAGHAVVGHVIGRCIAEVSILRDKKRRYRGYCAFNAFAEDVHGLTRWRDGSKSPECTTILYAGGLAVMMLCDLRGWNYERWRTGESADYEQIYRWGLEMYEDDKERETMQEECRFWAENILNRHWDAVEALVSALLVEGNISGMDAHIIIQQTIDPTITDWRMETWNSSTFL